MYVSVLMCVYICVKALDILTNHFDIALQGNTAQIHLKMNITRKLNKILEFNSKFKRKETEESRKAFLIVIPHC